MYFSCICGEDGDLHVLLLRHLEGALQPIIFLVIFYFLFILFYFILFYFIYLFIYLFLAVLGLLFCARAFSGCGKWGPLFIAVRGPLHYCGLSCCGARAPDAQAQ